MNYFKCHDAPMFPGIHHSHVQAQEICPGKKRADLGMMSVLFDGDCIMNRLLSNILPTPFTHPLFRKTTVVIKSEVQTSSWQYDCHDRYHLRIYLN